MIKIKTYIKILITLSQRFLRYIYDLILIVIYSIKNLLLTGKFYEENIIFVTAAEKNYFSQVNSLLESYTKNNNSKLLLYNIGLQYEQKIELTEKYSDIEIRDFDFSKYPSFIGEYFDNKLGNYAWKPIIIDELLNEFKSKVVWLDAGNIINKKIVFLKVALTAKKIIVPKSSNRIIDWTHNKTIEYIGLDSKHFRKNNYASGLIGFDYKSDIAKKISEEWKRFSMIQECIAPKGSSRGNHRQDQAVLTILLYKYLFFNIFAKMTYPKTNFILGVLFHKKRIFDF